MSGAGCWLVQRPMNRRRYWLAESLAPLLRCAHPCGQVRQVKFRMFEFLALVPESEAMTTPDQAPDVTLHEPREVAEFIQALGTSALELELIAIVTGWQKRSPRKISAAALLSSLCAQCHGGTASFNDIAMALDGASGRAPSRQSVAERFAQPCLRMIQTVLRMAFDRRVATSMQEDAPAQGCLTPYSRVLVQDSTIIELPGWLFDTFSGVANGTHQVCNARIQAAYDLKGMCFEAFSIDAYSKNDVSAAPELELRRGDLVLRDRGYLSVGEIVRHQQAGAHFIYRHKTGAIYRDVQTDDPLDLSRLLRRHGSLDMEVVLNDAPRTRVRLVAAPVSEQTANLRRMKAKKEMKGHNPSAAVLELMGWTIFLTDLGPGVSFSELLETYGLRWRIEVIFKAWKSQMNFHVIHRVSALELQICLTAKLVSITVGMGHLYRLCYQRMREASGRDLSLLKFTRYLATMPQRLVSLTEWLIEGAPATSHTCMALRKY